MQSVIKIQRHKGQNVVSAKELYQFLNVKRDFSAWCKQMFEYGFEPQSDFTPILGRSTRGRRTIDYALTMDTAKEISMLQRTEKGKFARRYFIECEKQLRKHIHNESGEVSLKARLYDIVLIRKGLNKEAAFIRYQLRKTESNEPVLYYPVFVQSQLFTA